MVLNLISLRQGLSLNPGLIDSVRLAGPSTSEIDLCLLSVGVTDVGHHHGLLLSLTTGDPASGPRACGASTFLT